MRTVTENEQMSREKVDPRLLEMAEVFHMPKSAVNRYIIMPVKHPKLYQMLYGRKDPGTKSGPDSSRT